LTNLYIGIIIYIEHRWSQRDHEVHYNCTLNEVLKMKTLTVIIIIVGIAVAVIGGIAILNAIQAENNNEAGSTESSSYSFGKETLKHLRVVDSKVHSYEQPAQNPLAIPIIVLFMGLIMIVAGAYDLRAPSLKNGVQPPGPT